MRDYSRRHDIVSMFEKLCHGLDTRMSESSHAPVALRMLSHEQSKSVWRCMIGYDGSK